jgi:nucleotide-binding universal stress UspA family protein
MGARCGTGHAFDMTRDGTGGPVVCGIGDGDVGTRVAAFAGGLASALATPLIAVRVEPPLDSDGSQPALLRGHARLTDALREAQGTAITHTVKLGDPAMALATVAEELRAQMLVVGTNESATLVGGVCQEVAMLASCPVVVVPRARAESGDRARQRRHILCAFDGSDDARPILGVAAAIAEQLETAAFVAHMRPGRVDDLRAHAQAGRAAMVVASSRAVQDWRLKLRKSTQDGWAPIGRIPLLLVPPAYEMGTARRRAGSAHPMELSGPSVR